LNDMTITVRLDSCMTWQMTFNNLEIRLHIEYIGLREIANGNEGSKLKRTHP